MDARILGQRLRQIRKRLGITQKQLAEATNLTQSVMSRMEKGEEIYASALLSIIVLSISIRARSTLTTFFLRTSM